jgi:hemerythrin
MDTKGTDVATYAKIVEDHRTLRGLLAHIDRALAGQTATIAEVGTLLGELGDRLVKHFALEEEGDYFADLMLRAPQLVVRANELMAQHPKMCTRARDLVVEFQAGQNPDDWWQETRRRFDAFCQELLKHEKGEDHLLQEAYTQDLGAHD